MGVALLSAPTLALAAPSGPAGQAVVAWFSSGPKLGCMDPDDRDLTCGPRNVPKVAMFYGNADGGPGTPDAVAVVIYQADPSGNAANVAAAAFRIDAQGIWRFSRDLPNIEGSQPVPSVEPRWGGGNMVVTMQVLRRGDGRYCPTGRKPVSLRLR